jgi:hypothetical protein
MGKKHLLAFLLIAVSVSLAACNRSNTVNTGENTNSVVKNENSGETDKKSGGQLTIITGEDSGAVLVRSTRFR